MVDRAALTLNALARIQTRDLGQGGIFLDSLGNGSIRSSGLYKIFVKLDSVEAFL